MSVCSGDCGRSAQPHLPLPSSFVNIFEESDTPPEFANNWCHTSRTEPSTHPPGRDGSLIRITDGWISDSDSDLNRADAITISPISVRDIKHIQVAPVPRPNSLLRYPLSTARRG